MKIIPAIDIIDGKCVRLTQGDYDQQTIYNDDPVQVAKAYEQLGVKFLHVVDLDGAKSGEIQNWDTIKRIARETNLNIDFGGGVSSAEAINKLFDLGVRQVNLGSIAVQHPEITAKWIKEFENQRIILSADVRDENVLIRGWEEKSGFSITKLLTNFLEFGIVYVTCTDISKDGMLEGPNIELYKRLVEQFPTLKFTASGGIRSIEDLRTLRQLDVDGVIIGKALFEGKISNDQIKEVLTESGSYQHK